jgi:hypothetical protein
MAYFRTNEMEDTLRQPPAGSAEESGNGTQDEYVESDYDDGFDDPAEPEEEELSEEERDVIRKKRFRILSGAGNLTAVIAGTVVILVLLALLMNMIGFVLNDADRNFTLFQLRF